MPVAGSKVYCDAVDKNKRLIDETKSLIRNLNVEINKRNNLIKQQNRNCKAIAWIDTNVEDGTNISKFVGGRKSRKSGKSKKSRKSRRR